MHHLFLQRIVTFTAMTAVALSVSAQPALPTLPANPSAPLPPLNDKALSSDVNPALPSDSAALLPSDAGLPALNLPQVAAPVPAPVVAPLTAAKPSDAPSNSGLPAVVASPAPTTASGETASAVLPATVGQSSAPAEKTYSFGDSHFSILFLPDQVNRMEDALRSFEESGGVASAPVAEVAPAAVAGVPEVIEDPLVYPVFYLASIAYDAPNDWSLWISGYKITSRKNDTDVSVLNVTRDSATFAWTPSFGKAFMRRRRDNLFAPTDAVKNKLAGQQRVQFDAATGTVVFTLKPNQSFVAGYDKLFEGYLDGPTLTALPVLVVPPVNSPASVAGDGSAQPVPATGPEGGVPPNATPGLLAFPTTNFNNGQTN